jgi:plasmid maintenance system killer protein
MAIQSFRHKGLRRLFESDDRRAIPASFADKLRDMLAAIGTANAVEDVGLFSRLASASAERQSRGLLERYSQRQLARDFSL